MLFVVWGDSRVLGVNQELRSYLLLYLELLVGRMIDSCFGPMDCLLFFGGFGWSEFSNFRNHLFILSSSSRRSIVLLRCGLVPWVLLGGVNLGFGKRTSGLPCSKGFVLSIFFIWEDFSFIPSLVCSLTKVTFI